MESLCLGATTCTVVRAAKTAKIPPKQTTLLNVMPGKKGILSQSALKKVWKTWGKTYKKPFLKPLSSLSPKTLADGAGPKNKGPKSPKSPAFVVAMLVPRHLCDHLLLSTHHGCLGLTKPSVVVETKPFLDAKLDVLISF